LTAGYFDSKDNDDAFFKYEGNLVRLHNFGKGFIGEFKATGQFSPTDQLPWIEQYQTGGMSSVRGYTEGVLMGRNGYTVSAELITPLPILPKRIGGPKIGYIYPRDIIKGAVFVDHGGIFRDTEGMQGVKSSEFLVSTGAGLRINVTDEILARLYLGFGLNNTQSETDKDTCRFHFELTTRPDLTRLIKPKEEL
jgi:hemolysin activation/secretion protein